MSSKTKAQELLAAAGITINGPAPTDIQVHNDGLYDRVFSGGTLALGEAYMDSWWDVKDVSGFFYKAIRSDIARGVMSIGMLWHVARAWVINRQNKSRAFVVGQEHYDIG